MRFLVAPDKFKDALPAEAAAEAIAAGLRDALPAADVAGLPLADGGEGSGRLLARAIGATPRTARVLDPLGRPRHASWWHDAAGRRAIVELAEASGLALLAEQERSATRSTSFGTGQLLRAAADGDCREILLCVGGSATVDGGVGCLQALGWQFLTRGGGVLAAPARGASLIEIAGMRAPATAYPAAIRILTDVDNPLLGPCGAAAVFGPQKGAAPEDVLSLERGLAHWAAALTVFTGRDVSQIAGGGAAGGLPAGLAAALGAMLVRGFDEIASAVDLKGKLAGADLCITGEGRLDAQSVGNKVVGGVCRLAASRGVPVVALVGAADPAPYASLDELARAIGLKRVVVVSPSGRPLRDALAETAANLRRAACELARDRIES